MDEIVPHSNWREGNFASIRDSGSVPPPDSSGQSITVDDILFALWRHKWLIVFCSLLGFVAAGILYKITPRMYASEGRVMVKSVAQNDSIGPAAGGAQVRELPVSGAVMNSEIGILTSSDLARQVAETVGPERVLEKLNGGNDLDAARMAIVGGLHAYVPSQAQYISVIFQHPDRSLVQPILSNLMERYPQKHYQVHRALGNSAEFEDEKQRVKERVDKLMRQLQRMRETNSVFSFADARTAAEEEVRTTAKALRDLNAQLAELQFMLKRFQKDGTTNAPVIEDPAYLASRKEYAQLLQDLAMQNDKQRLMLAQGYKLGSDMVRSYRETIAELEEQKKKLEKEFPDLVRLAISNTNVFDPVLASARVEDLKIKILTTSNRLLSAQAEEARIYNVADELSDLESQLTREKKNLDYLTDQLARAKWDAALQSSRDSTVNIIQWPTPPVLQLGPLYKKMGMAAGAGVGGGIALALLIQLFLDQRVKRPEELRRLLPIPVYLSIPYGARKETRRRIKDSSGPGGNGALVKTGEAIAALNQVTNGSSDRLQPYFDSLRDRVLGRFESLARKPKLVGVSGCIGGSPGSSRIAAGLAAALSEAGDLKILLVDMKSCNGKPHPILGRRKSCTLEEVLENQKTEDALVAPNLYLASAESQGSHPIARSSPQFARSIPQMAASDYDYIVFDMPEVDQISITPRLAKHMDLMLLVVEAEKTHRNVVKDAGSLLSEFTPNVAMVLNNTKAALPKSLRSIA